MKAPNDPTKLNPDVAEREALREKAEQNAKAVDARIRWWISQGLVNSDANTKTLIDFVESHKKLNSAPVTVELIDAVIQILRDKLEWRAPAAPPAPAPAPEPVEELVALPDGSMQKSIHDTPDNSWTAAQARDWSKRTNQQAKLRSQIYGGPNYLRTRWFDADSQVR